MRWRPRLLLLGGAVGKSAQLPLQTWLPDAMAGPTPTSALIHAATMVTAGVYLIARTHVLFSLAPAAQFAVGVVGAATLILAGFSALTQPDIKRVLAYSTISQIGYMFLALGVGAWSAAIFHFMTHAFFKALLFLGRRGHHRVAAPRTQHFQDGRPAQGDAGGLLDFLAAGCSLAGSAADHRGLLQQGADYLGLVFVGSGQPCAVACRGDRRSADSPLYLPIDLLVFFGEAKTHVHKRPGPAMMVPCVTLAVLSVVGGFFGNSGVPGRRASFPDFMHHGFAGDDRSAHGRHDRDPFRVDCHPGLYDGPLSGLLLLHSEAGVRGRVTSPALGKALHQFWLSDWGMDWLYERVFVRPIIWVARVDKGDFVDSIYTGIAGLTELLYHGVRKTETGRMRWYAAGIAAGSIIFIAIVLFL